MIHKSNPHIACYGSHDSNICIKVGKNEYRVYELERLTGIRNFSLTKCDNETFRDVISKVHEIIKDDYGFEEYSSLFYSQLTPEQVSLFCHYFGNDHHEEMSHHSAHAACAAYQSHFNESLVISFDGGGHEINEGVTSMAIFRVDKTKPHNHNVTKISNLPFDFCHPYTMLAIPISEIWKKDAMTDYLKYAGKLMGLAAYGNIRGEWLDAFNLFFIQRVTEYGLKQLGEKIGLDFADINTISGQDSYDIAATAQYVFEQQTLGIIYPYVVQNNIPICLTGGAAMNVLCNTIIKNVAGREVFVPCNPNDSGLSFGMMAIRDAPESGVAEIMYSGFGILDIDELQQYVNDRNAQKIDVKGLAKMIVDGKVIGVMRGNSEVGARALGNRSLLAHAAIDGMKDRMNKIKGREFFRPVAPLCRIDDVDKYFEFVGESPYMSFAAKVKGLITETIPLSEESTPAPRKNILESITHEDGTARLQTVTYDQNEWLYRLCESVDTLSDCGVLVNTSLNVKSKPICTTIKEAIEILETTDIDAMYINGFLFTK